ncbi:M48 family metallopeptidase [Noviherbaspirillum aridicola]|uniref:Peptidase M48 n=1 Tax=Noviherbaspirillum aridicola TaxID=2849687 RepID=A0ABQ4Q434_9BURK|nr:M48 family metallopeptidase [Noviherbaspirillum aridicola]GIZ51550.1 peptidase M48 [Noviherbaspirillum aridicola]
MRVPAFYFDGKTSRRHVVTLQMTADAVLLEGEVERRYPLDAVTLSEASRSMPRRLSFPDGASLEILDNRAFIRLLEDSGRPEPLVVRMYQSWRGTVLALAMTVALLVAGHQYALPLLAAQLAHAVPASVEQRLARDTLALLDQNLFGPTELAPERQAELRRRFASLAMPERKELNVELLFRKSRAGPNAFALPAGRIVLTDQLVERIENDEALVAVMAHELGHVAQRHLLRRLIHVTSTGAAMTVLFGDFSALAANLPTVLLDLKYSREVELEADDYAVRLLRLNGIGPDALASALRSLEASADHASETTGYLSTHPALAERIARLSAH